MRERYCLGAIDHPAQPPSACTAATGPPRLKNSPYSKSSAIMFKFTVGSLVTISGILQMKSRTMTESRLILRALGRHGDLARQPAQRVAQLGRSPHDKRATQADQEAPNPIQ